MKLGLMAHHFRVTTLMARSMVRVALPGPTEAPIKESLLKIILKVRANTNGAMVEYSLVTGLTIKCTATVCLHGQMVACMTDSMLMIKKRDWVRLVGLMVANTLANGLMANRMVKVSTQQPMERQREVYGRMESALTGFNDSKL
jgi:hypothetical protein